VSFSVGNHPEDRGGSCVCRFRPLGGGCGQQQAAAVVAQAAAVVAQAAAVVAQAVAVVRQWSGTHVIEKIRKRR
jgi:hypothetical protein